MTDSHCFSGGAKGADAFWGEMAHKAGHRVTHLSFTGHRCHVPEEDVIRLTREELLEADPYLYKANETLKRAWPVRSEGVANLLRRNFYQIIFTDSVYAVAQLDNQNLVKGGTAWACQLYLDRATDHHRLYVFDQLSCVWWSWDSGWLPIDRPPSPSGYWTGIGSRDLLASGRAAIHELFSD